MEDTKIPLDKDKKIERYISINEDAHKEFEAWFGGLLWSEPYPNQEEMARMAWLCAHDFYKKNHESTIDAYKVFLKEEHGIEF